MSLTHGRQSILSTVRMVVNLAATSELLSCESCWELSYSRKFLTKHARRYRPEKLTLVGNAPAGGSLDVTQVTGHLLKPGLSYVNFLPTISISLTALRIILALILDVSTLSTLHGMQLVNLWSRTGKPRVDTTYSPLTCTSAPKAAAAPLKATHDLQSTPPLKLVVVKLPLLL